MSPNCTLTWGLQAAEFSDGFCCRWSIFQKLHQSLPLKKLWLELSEINEMKTITILTTGLDNALTSSLSVCLPVSLFASFRWSSYLIILQILQLVHEDKKQGTLTENAKRETLNASTGLLNSFLCKISWGFKRNFPASISYYLWNYANDLPYGIHFEAPAKWRKRCPFRELSTFPTLSLGKVITN